MREGLAKVMRYFRMERGRIYVYDPIQNLLILHTSRGLDPKGLERVNLGEGFTGKAATTRCFLAQKVTDMANRERSGKPCHQVVCLPLVADDRLLGVVNLGATKTIELDPETIDLMLVVGNILALAVLNAQYAEEIRTQGSGRNILSPLG